MLVLGMVHNVNSELIIQYELRDNKKRIQIDIKTSEYEDYRRFIIIIIMQ